MPLIVRMQKSVFCFVFSTTSSKALQANLRAYKLKKNKK
jgi:hypothetical protein